ncbi:MAG: Acyl carrier protein [bacterium ADurb.Bin243]|nr:MAG: Acyl carrier protein [bacterium ADurb.Bin243]HOD41104.1 phosphopantetheine-binding protein [Candidatus Wallbacteria bacterium]
MQRNEIIDGVKQCLLECVRTEADKITLKSKIIDDLGADSLDLLDIIFTLERKFKIKIKQGEIIKMAQEGIPAEDFQQNDRLMPKGVERLKEVLSEVDVDEIKEGMSTAKIPYLFNVETFVKIVERNLAKKS